MRVQNPKKFKRLVAGRCKYCGRQFFYRRDNRPKFFCDDACRQRDFRNARADFRHTRLYPSQRNESPQKSRAKPRVSRRNFADRPLNILGGHRWSNTIAVDRETLIEIIATEIGSFKSEANSESPTPCLAEIPADLSIPAFLRRRPS